MNVSVKIKTSCEFTQAPWIAGTNSSEHQGKSPYDSRSFKQNNVTTKYTCIAQVNFTLE